MIDLDGLKHINDTYGHEFGDKYIQIAADVFMDSVPDGTVVSRPGGEPFPLHLSAGVAWYPQDTTDSKIFMQYADFAMYQIRHTVKNQFGYFDMEAYRTSQEQYNEEKG